MSVLGMSVLGMFVAYAWCETEQRSPCTQHRLGLLDGDLRPTTIAELPAPQTMGHIRMLNCQSLPALHTRTSVRLPAGGGRVNTIVMRNDILCVEHSLPEERAHSRSAQAIMHVFLSLNAWAGRV